MSETLTNVSDIMSSKDFTSTETVDTITADDHDIANKSILTEEAFQETEKILEDLANKAIECLPTG